MSRTGFAAQLARHGPHAPVRESPSLREARAYCRRLAKRHYENFTVGSLLLPRAMRPHFFAVYAYCRWADDLADEVKSRADSLALLDWWQEQLMDCYAAKATHPVFVALRETVMQFDIPPRPFLDLLTAFRRDQRQRRYETRDDLLNYCRGSANPVGRLVLYLGRSHDAESVELSDAVCTGLQLANFCQDVANDWQRGRIYLPQQQCRQAGYDESMFATGEYNAEFRDLLAGEVQYAEDLLLRGWSLVARVPRDLKLDVALFVRGGLAILQAIRQVEYDVWSRRPTVGKLAKMRLVLNTWADVRRGRLN
jgi:squalene synthase HpnC